jgi:hypothetical protein
MNETILKGGCVSRGEISRATFPDIDVSKRCDAYATMDVGVC